MKLVILDRDGVINHDSDQFIKSPEEWKPIPGSLEAIARLSQAGYRLPSVSGVRGGLEAASRARSSDSSARRARSSPSWANRFTWAR